MIHVQDYAPHNLIYRMCKAEKKNVIEGSENYLLWIMSLQRFLGSRTASKHQRRSIGCLCVYLYRVITKTTDV